MAQQGKFSRIWWISSKNCKKCKKSKNERIVDESSLLRSTYCTICIEKTLIRTLPVRAFRRNQLVQKSNLRVTQVLCLINNVNTKIMDGPVFYCIWCENRLLTRYFEMVSVLLVFACWGRIWNYFAALLFGGGVAFSFPYFCNILFLLYPPPKKKEKRSYLY